MGIETTVALILKLVQSPLLGLQNYISLPVKTGKLNSKRHTACHPVLQKTYTQHHGKVTCGELRFLS